MRCLTCTCTKSRIPRVVCVVREKKPVVSAERFLAIELLFSQTLYAFDLLVGNKSRDFPRSSVGWASSFMVRYAMIAKNFSPCLIPGDLSPFPWFPVSINGSMNVFRRFDLRPRGGY